MSFKEQLEKDQSVFFNLDEFGEVIKWENKEIVGILSNETKYVEGAKGPMKLNITQLRFPQKNLEQKPLVNKEVTLNGKKVRISSCYVENNDYVVEVISHGRD